MKIKIILKITLISLLVVLVSCSKPEAFKLMLMPDMQTCSKLYPKTLIAQTEWVVAHADSVAFLLQQGDITDNNNDEQWQNATAAMFLLDNKLPYTVVTGNHDLGTNGSSDIRNSDLFNQYFPYTKYSKTKNFGGTYEAGKMDNTWYIFKAGGIEWLILSLEFAPRNSVLEWACKVVEQHPNQKIIVNTHAYLYSDNLPMKEGDDWLPEVYGLGKAIGDSAVNNGQQMWEKFVSRYPNIMFVFSGHVISNGGVGRLVSEGKSGNKVYQMLANYQSGVEGIKGDEGYIRIITIDPQKRRVSVKTYSPVLNQYRTEPEQQFVFENVAF